MKGKDICNDFKLIKKTFSPHGLYKNISALQGYICTLLFRIKFHRLESSAENVIDTQKTRAGQGDVGGRGGGGGVIGTFSVLQIKHTSHPVSRGAGGFGGD